MNPLSYLTQLSLSLLILAQAAQAQVIEPNTRLTQQLPDVLQQTKEYIDEVKQLQKLLKDHAQMAKAINQHTTVAASEEGQTWSRIQVFELVKQLSEGMNQKSSVAFFGVIKDPYLIPFYLIGKDSVPLPRTKYIHLSQAFDWIKSDCTGCSFSLDEVTKRTNQLIAEANQFAMERFSVWMEQQQISTALKWQLDLLPLDEQVSEAVRYFSLNPIKERYPSPQTELE